MGLNHSFKIRFPIEHKQAIAGYLYKNTLGDPIIDPEFPSGQSGSICILVPPDRFIKRYFRGLYHSPFGPATRVPENLKVKGLYGIGGVDFRVSQTDPVFFSIDFVCVTSDMSLLFNDSPGVRAWFAGLCRTGQADFGMYTCENNYYEVFWWEHAERALRISFHIYNHPEESLDILKDFYPLAFDSWYNVFDE